ncbi:ABATE domain-containing protein [Allonocardiopsis opalescens]|uniref:Putative stress-induced transcription regulator n=1 Tax=Allonocardiopsis opalescens TaxID=1144618 RepID=A0A2T0Q448_9ACTN|nr:ABATE domain-containing protein [Allonocardiopsis opalescens]PRX98562.1 putative stress-induced transcription regulator [Allonocardiopsis opalescens]
MTELSAAAELVGAFVRTLNPDTGADRLADRRGLAEFLRERGLASGPIPISVSHHTEALDLRAGLRAQLHRGAGRRVDPADLDRGARALDGLRISARLEPAGEPPLVLAPAVVDELRRCLAVIAAAWATVVISGEWRSIEF